MIFLRFHYRCEESNKGHKNSNIDDQPFYFNLFQFLLFAIAEQNIDD